MTLTDEERVGALLNSISPARLERYLQICDQDKPRAIELYERNLRLAAAFYVPLQCWEVTLRNHFNNLASDAFGANWLCEPHRFARGDFINPVKYPLSKQPAVSGTSLIAELTLGFWVALLGPQYTETLWKPLFFKAFTHNGKFMSRKVVHGRFNALRRFRNRVAHHEPIIFNDLAHTHAELIEAISWMCPITAEWTAEQSSVMRHLP